RPGLSDAPARRLRCAAPRFGLRSEPAPPPSRTRAGVLLAAASSARPLSTPPRRRCLPWLRAPPLRPPRLAANSRKKYADHPHAHSLVHRGSSSVLAYGGFRIPRAASDRTADIATARRA